MFFSLCSAACLSDCSCLKSAVTWSSHFVFEKVVLALVAAMELLSKMFGWFSNVSHPNDVNLRSTLPTRKAVSPRSDCPSLGLCRLAEIWKPQVDAKK